MNSATRAVSMVVSLKGGVARGETPALRSKNKSHGIVLPVTLMTVTKRPLKPVNKEF